MKHYNIPEWSHIRVGKSKREKDSVIQPEHADQLEKATRASFPKKMELIIYCSSSNTLSNQTIMLE